MKTAFALVLALSACNTPADTTTAGSTGSTGSASAGIPDPGEKVLSVNGTPIGLNELGLVFEKMRVPKDQIPEFAWTRNGKKAAEDYGLAVVLHERALAENLKADPDVQKQLALAERQVLASAMRTKLAKAAVTDAAITEFYEKNKSRFDKPEVKARQIRVATEPEAQEVLARLKKGEDFATVAKEKSTDPGSKAKGGDVGWFQEQANPIFGKDAFAAEKGAMIGPIENRGAFYVVEVQDKRDSTPMEEVRPEAAEQIEHAESTKVIEDLRSSLKYEWVREPSNEPAPGMPGMPGMPGQGMPDMRNPHAGGMPRSPHGIPGGVPTRPIPIGPGAPGGAPAPAPAPAPAGGGAH